MMHARQRMSPLTAFFFGLFGIGGITVAAATIVVLQGMRMADRYASGVLDVANLTVDQLPELIQNLPPLLEELVGTRCVDYSEQLAVVLQPTVDPTRKVLLPTISIANQGKETVTFLSVNVTARDSGKQLIAEWTEAIATPIGVDRDMRGPLLPGATRHAILRSGYNLSIDQRDGLTLAYEITDVVVRKHEDRHVSVNHIPG